MSKVRDITLNIDITKNGMKCTNPIITIFNSDIIAFPCGKLVDSKGNLKITVPESAFGANSCVKGYVQCEKCDRCGEFDFEICLCGPNTELTTCQVCVDGIITDKCSKKELTQGKICTPGGCDCPEDKPYFNEYLERCVVCEEGSVHPTNKCLVCVNGDYTQKDCGNGSCNPNTGDCIPNCDDPNAIWNVVTKECDCKTGYVDSVNGCIPEPECYPGDDVGPCKECVNNQIVDVICPDPNQRCIDDDCVDWPCEDIPCSNGLDCGDDCGCLQEPSVDVPVLSGCVPCAQLSCEECGKALGCECNESTGFVCTKVTDPCKNFDCPEGCAGRADCGCDDNEDCVTVDSGPCGEDDFTLKQTDCDEECKLEAKLSVDSCCPCPTLIVDIRNTLVDRLSPNTGGPITGSRAGDNITDVQLNDTIYLRKDVVGEPLLTDDLNENVNNQEELTSGGLTKEITYVYRRELSGVFYEVLDTIYSNRSLVENQGFIDNSIHSDQLNIRDFGSIDPNALEGDLDFGTLIRTEVVYTVTSDLVNSRNTCSYTKRQVAKFIYSINSMLRAERQIKKHFRSSDCSRPTFKWYRGEEVTPFRKKYVAKDIEGNYTDYIKEDPRINAIVADDTAIDQHNDLVSGLRYDVFTDCGCGGVQQAKKEGCETVYFCENCDAKFEVKDSCGAIIGLTEDFIAKCRLNRRIYDQNIANNYGQEQQVSWSFELFDIDGKRQFNSAVADWDTGLLWAKDREFKTDGITPVRSIRVKMNHDICERCVIEQEFDNILEDVPYTTDCRIGQTNNGDLFYTFIVSLGNFPANVQTATVRGASNIGGNVFELNLLEGATEVILDVTYVGGCAKQQIIPITVNCQPKFETEEIVPDCGSTDDLKLTFKQVGTNLPGSTVWTNGLGQEIGTGDELLINSSTSSGGVNPLFVTPFNVVFQPTNTTLGPVEDTFNVNLPSVSTVNPTTGTTTDFTTCGTDDYIISFPVSCDNGVVSYTLSSDGVSRTAVVNNGSIDIVVEYDAGNTNTATITEINSLEGCCVNLEPKSFTVAWGQGCVVDLFATPLDQICQSDDLTISINGSGSCNLTFGIYTSGTNTLLSTQSITFNGTGVYNFTNLPLGNLDIKLIAIGDNTTSECDNQNNAANVVVGILVNPSASISSQLVSCEGNVSGSNDYVIRVLDENGQPTANAVINPLPTSNNGDGTYSGSVIAGTELMISLPNTTNCVNNITTQTINCGCTNIPQPVVSNESYCFGANSVTLNATNNPSNMYSVEWTYLGVSNPSGNTFNINNPSGTFTVSVIFVDDSTGCFSEATEVIVTGSDPLGILINNNNSGTENACIGDNVVFSASIGGGSGNYSYMWSKDGGPVLGNQSSLQLNNVQTSNAGTYTVSVTDTTTGCIDTAQITLAVTLCDPCVGVNILVGGLVQNEECSANNSSNGSVNINNISGGTFPYSISGDLTMIVNNGLSAGTYNVTVTDANGCIAQQTFVVGDENDCTQSCNCQLSVAPTANQHTYDSNTDLINIQEITAGITLDGNCTYSDMTYTANYTDGTSVSRSLGDAGFIITPDPFVPNRYILTMNNLNLFIPRCVNGSEVVEDNVITVTYTNGSTCTRSGGGRVCLEVPGLACGNC